MEFANFVQGFHAPAASDHLIDAEVQPGNTILECLSDVTISKRSQLFSESFALSIHYLFFEFSCLALSLLAHF